MKQSEKKKGQLPKSENSAMTWQSLERLVRKFSEVKFGASARAEDIAGVKCDCVIRLNDGSAVIVPAGARHNVRNTGDGPLNLYTLYGPPEHKDGIVQSTKEEADARHSAEEWDGRTTEQRPGR